MKKILMALSFSALVAGMFLFASCDWNKDMVRPDALTITGATELDICEYDDAAHQYILTSTSESPKFTLKGNDSNCQIVSKTKDTILKLEGVNLSNNEGVPVIYGEAKFELSAVEGTENFISNSGSSDEKIGAVLSEKGLEIGGSGKLTIEGNVLHGVKATKIEVKGSGEFAIKGTAGGSAINCNIFTVKADRTFTLILSDAKNGIKADETIDIASGTFCLKNLETGLKTDTSKDDGDVAEPIEHHINVTGGKIFTLNVTKDYKTEKGKDSVAEDIIEPKPEHMDF